MTDALTLRRPGAGTDGPAAVVSVVAFSIALGIGTVALPLLALASGYSPATIGLLAASSAITQLLARLQLPWLLDRMPDRVLIAAAGVLLGASYLALLLSASLPSFIVSQLLQGSARALFWTATQTHAVRGASGTVRTLAKVMGLSGVGSMIGPVLAGVLAGISFAAALGAGLATAVLTTVACLGLDRLPPYARRAEPTGTQLWRRSGVDLACWSNFAGGGWRAILGSYVPVILTAAGLAPGIVGSLVALADAAGIAILVVLVRLPSQRIHPALELGVVAACLALAALPAAASAPVAVGILLALGGAGAGTIVTLGPAVASESVRASEQGAAIAAAGTFRAAALLLAPAAVAGSLSAIGLGPAIALVALAIGAPTLVVRRLPRRLGLGTPSAT
ncbi:MAG: MFS transporter [Candidatus Limnocylindrales bacterium]